MHNRFRDAIDMSGWPDRAFGPGNGIGLLNSILKWVNEMALYGGPGAERPEEDDAIRLMLWYVAENVFFVMGEQAPGFANKPSLRWHLEEAITRMKGIKTGTEAQCLDWVVRCHVAGMAKLANVDEISATYHRGEKSEFYKLGLECEKNAKILEAKS